MRLYDPFLCAVPAALYQSFLSDLIEEKEESSMKRAKGR